MNKHQKCEQTPNFSVFNTLEPLLVNIKYHSVFMLSLIETPNEIYWLWVNEMSWTLNRYLNNFWVLWISIPLNPCSFLWQVILDLNIPILLSPFQPPIFDFPSIDVSVNTSNISTSNTFQSADSSKHTNMESSQQYCLRWKYHHSNLQSMFSQLLERECFCDVTLACEGKHIRAHKVRI